jgi:hypothetical protein
VARQMSRRERGQDNDVDEALPPGAAPARQHETHGGHQDAEHGGAGEPAERAAGAGRRPGSGWSGFRLPSAPDGISFGLAVAGHPSMREALPGPSRGPVLQARLLHVPSRDFDRANDGAQVSRPPAVPPPIRRRLQFFGDRDADIEQLPRQKREPWTGSHVM